MPRHKKPQRCVDRCASCNRVIGVGTDPEDFWTPEFREWSQGFEITRTNKEARKHGLCAECHEQDRSTEPRVTDEQEDTPDAT